MLVRGRSYAPCARFSAVVASGTLARRARSGRQERAAAAFLCQVAVGALPTLQAAAEPCLSVANPTRRKPALCCRRLRDACQASSLRTAGAGSGCLLVSSRRRRPADSTGRGRAMLSRDRMCALGARFSAAVGSGSLAGEFAQDGRSGQRLPPCVKSR